MSRHSNQTKLLNYFTHPLPWVVIMIALSLVSLSGCAQVNVPGARNLKVPPPQQAANRMKGVNERKDAVTEVKLGSDILVPRRSKGEPLPEIFVGPYELRGETLASALQLILSDLDIAMAFETQEGLTRRITIANLRGMLPDVVEQVCSLADLYCSFENGLMTIKETEMFIVDLPPLGTSSSSDSGSDSDSDSDSSGGLDDIVSGVAAIAGGTTN